MPITHDVFETLLHDNKCPTCQGSGEIDDAATGDISFDVFYCPHCGGHGFKDRFKFLTELDKILKGALHGA